MSLKTEKTPREIYAAMLAELQRELVRQVQAVAEAA